MQIAAAVVGGVVLVVAVAVTSGSGGDGESTAREKPKFSAASEPPQVFIERLAKLLETTVKEKDCGQLNTISGRSYTRFSCPPAKALRKSMASFEVVGAEEYGTGAVVDYKSGKVKDGAAILLFVAPGRQWGISRFGVLTEPSIDSSDEESRPGFDRAVRDYLSAVVKRDCKAFSDVAFTAGLKSQEICKTMFPGTEPLAKRMKQNRKTEPKYLGGNSRYGFFAFETAKPEVQNSTISVLRDGVGSAERYVIMDVAPSPTTAELRQAREQAAKQRKRGAPNSMAPGQGKSTGRKAD